MSFFFETMEEVDIWFENIMRRTRLENELIALVGEFKRYRKYHVELRDYNGRRSYMILTGVCRTVVRDWMDHGFYKTPPPKGLLDDKMVYAKLRYQNQLKAIMAIKRIDKLKRLFLDRYYSRRS